MKRLSILLLLVFAVGGTTASAQDKYPSKPIKVVVPFGPGSATDIVMRIVGEQMRPILGQPVLVENKPGAFGILAIEEMARSRPDGYTLQIGNPGTNVLTPIIYKKKFKIDYDKDVILLTRLSEVPLVLGATTKDFPPKTYAEFIAYAKANPGKVRYASVGVGSNNHYDMKLSRNGRASCSPTCRTREAARQSPTISSPAMPTSRCSTRQARWVW
jgi:tripartite-type tricarboxylate transporter receptor subunit TctC